MKRFAIGLATLAMMFSTVAFAQDGAALYKSKCAMCHGADGQGKSAPAIKGKANVEDVLTKGGLKGPHSKPFSGLSGDQAKAIAASLK